MPIERRPVNLVPKDYIPPKSRPYRVHDGDSWISVAQANAIEAWDLIYANFKTRDPAEVNWYLRYYVGCVRPTADLRNWMFSSRANPGIIHIPQQVVKLPPPLTTKPAAATPSKLAKLWAGLGKSHSGDLFVIGAHDLTAKVYNLGNVDDVSKTKNAWINVNGWKFGAGLGGSVGGVFVIAHPYETAWEMKGVAGDWDFDIAIGTKLGDFLKDVKGLGKVVDTVEKYKKLKYITENAIKNLKITEPGIYTIPIPFAGAGIHLWGGYKFGDVTVVSTGTGVP